MHLDDLLRLNGPPFITAAYLAILKRQVDPSGMDHFSRRLALGDSKESVISALATSPEATGSRIDVVGLKQLLKRHRKSPWKRFIQSFRTTRLQRQIARLEHMVAIHHEEVLRELASLRETHRSVAEMQFTTGNLGDAVADTLQKLKVALETSTQDPEVMLDNFEQVIRSSTFPDRLSS